MIQRLLFRFPKDLEIQKIWVQKCKREDKFNPSSSYVCFQHFCADAFARDMKAELLGQYPFIFIFHLNIPKNCN